MLLLTEGLVFEVLKQSLRPEFLNRIDEVVMFQPLNSKHIRRIVELQLKGLEKILSKQAITLKATKQAIDYIAGAGFDPQFGARPLHRAIQKYLEDPLAEFILNNNPEEGSALVAEMIKDEDNIKISLAKKVKNAEKK